MGIMPYAASEALYLSVHSRSLVRGYPIHYAQSGQGLPYTLCAVWSGATIYTMHSLVRKYPLHYAQSGQGLPYTLCAVWSGATIYTMRSLVRKYPMHYAQSG
ncbi:hypothetical protein DPMN_183225 [Dreissena polymorpha]|uniref:Uncharacterized protein n=1 Tax=Dreissena polymorpha TaxID=45954 RepID=A0A9D4DH07_DREPO|nr:hypothetical protein DPMN_183225 [Dreissena polymorpha]